MWLTRQTNQFGQSPHKQKAMKHAKLILAAIVIALCSCSDNKTPEQLFDECRSGVVLILNQYYYRMTLPDGSHIYFSGTDRNGNYDFKASVQELEEQQQAYGTGFFIDDKGTIMTNRHVIEPQIDRNEVKKQLNNILDYMVSIYNYQLIGLRNQFNNLEMEKNNSQYWLDGAEYTDRMRIEEIENQQEELSEQFDSLSAIRDEIALGKLTISQIKVEPICKIGIAYDGNHVNSTADFLVKNPCTVIRKSDDEDIDLALLRLNSNKTPDDAYVFSVDGKQDNSTITEKVKSIFGEKKPQKLTIDQQLYMIGYNAGPILANTKQGIKVQMTSGKITQVPDGDKLLYSIPTVQGSSGSPVIDAEGNLQAVNFAKLAISDNFNFGIPINKVRRFLTQD